MYCLHTTQKSVADSGALNKKFNGGLLIREIALFSGAHQRSLKLFLIVSILGKLALPFIARFMVFGTLSLEWDGILYTVLECLALSFFLLQNYYFIAAGHVDFHRRL